MLLDGWTGMRVFACFLLSTGLPLGVFHRYGIYIFELLFIGIGIQPLCCFNLLSFSNKYRCKKTVTFICWESRKALFSSDFKNINFLFSLTFVLVFR